MTSGDGRRRVAISLADLALLPRPIAGPHRFLVDLANGGQRQPIDELDALWRMRGALAVLDELDEARGNRGEELLDKDQDGRTPFAPGCVPGRATTSAQTASPHLASGMPMTHAMATSG